MVKTWDWKSRELYSFNRSETNSIADLRQVTLRLNPANVTHCWVSVTSHSLHKPQKRCVCYRPTLQRTDSLVQIVAAPAFSSRRSQFNPWFVVQGGDPQTNINSFELFLPKQIFPLILLVLLMRISSTDLRVWRLGSSRIFYTLLLLDGDNTYHTWTIGCLIHSYL